MSCRAKESRRSFYPSLLLHQILMQWLGQAHANTCRQKEMFCFISTSLYPIALFFPLGLVIHCWGEFEDMLRTVGDNSPQMQAAKRKGLTVLGRRELWLLLLREVFRGWERNITDWMDLQKCKEMEGCKLWEKQHALLHMGWVWRLLVFSSLIFSTNL